MPSPGEGEQGQHLQPLGEIRVHIGSEAMETVLAQVSRNQSKMIPGPVGADLRSQRVEEVEHSVSAARDHQEPVPKHWHSLCLWSWWGRRFRLPEAAGCRENYDAF